MSTTYPQEKQPPRSNPPPTQDSPSENDALPPPYSGPSSSTTPQVSSPPTTTQTTELYPLLPTLTYAHYVPPNCSLSADKTTTTCTSPLYGRSPAALLQLIHEQASIPPRIVVRIQGSSNGAVDFDVRVNLMPLFVPPLGEGGKPREKWAYVRTIGEGEVGWRGGTRESAEPGGRGGVEEWVGRYCRDGGARQFLIHRTTTNLDTPSLTGNIHALLASTNYHGHVTISFPTTFSHFLLKSSASSSLSTPSSSHPPSPSPSSPSPKPKRTSFFSTLTSAVTSLFAPPKRYEVITVVWPFASVRPGEDGRRFATVSEEVWWREWQGAIRRAVLEGRKGWVTVEDRLEGLMDPGVGRGSGVVREWGRDLM